MTRSTELFNDEYDFAAGDNDTPNDVSGNPIRPFVVKRISILIFKEHATDDWRSELESFQIDGEEVIQNCEGTAGKWNQDNMSISINVDVDHSVPETGSMTYEWTTTISSNMLQQDANLQIALHYE